jgi:hypothetical protein
MTTYACTVTCYYLVTSVYLLPIIYIYIYISHNTHRAAKGKRMHSFYSFATSALDGGERSASRLVLYM